jgi:hypothetical protein
MKTQLDAQTKVAESADGTFAIHGDCSPELKSEIRGVMENMQPSGEMLGMGVRLWSKDDLEFMLRTAQTNLSAHTQNRWNSLVESESGNASGKCVCAVSLTNGGAQ